jgi:hypothetical protein
MPPDGLLHFTDSLLAHAVNLVVSLGSIGGRSVGAICSSGEDLASDVIAARKRDSHAPQLIKPSLQSQEAMSPPNDLGMERHDRYAILEVSEHVDNVIGPIAKDVIRGTQSGQHGARGVPVIFKVRIIIQGPAHRQFHQAGRLAKMHRAFR